MAVTGLSLSLHLLLGRAPPACVANDTKQARSV